MADAVVLSPEQIKQLLAQQQQSTATATVHNAPSTSAHPAKPRQKTSFKKHRTLEPFYTGGPLALTPDARSLAAALNQHVALIDTHTGQLLHRIDGDSEDITALTISPDGAHLIVASRSLALHTYALPDCHLVRSTPKSHTAQVNVIQVDPTSTLVATGSSDGVVKVWDIAGGYCTHVFRGHGGVVSGLCWNMPNPALEAAAAAKGRKPINANAPQQQRRIELFTGSVDGKIRLWDLAARTEATHKPAATLNGHVSVVRGLAVTDDGTRLVSGSRDNSIILWQRTDDGRWKLRHTLAANEGVESAGFLARGTTLGGSSGGSSAKATAEQQTLFYTGGSSGEVKLWDASAGVIVAREPKSVTQQMALDDVAASGRRRAGAGNDDDEGEETRALTAVHYLPAASVLVCVHADQNIVVRSVPSPSSAAAAVPLPPLAKVRQMVGFNDEIVDVSLLCARGRGDEQGGGRETHVAIATNSASIRVYAAGEGEHDVSLLYGHGDVVLCLDRSPDARWMASGAKDRTARIWAWVPASRLPKYGEGGDADAVVGQPLDRDGCAATKSKKKKGKKSAVNDDDEDADHDHDHAEEHGEWICVAICEGHAESVGAIAFARRATSPGALGAPFMVTASQDRTAKLWDLSALSMLLSSSNTEVISAPLRLKSLLTLKIHDKDINSLDVSPNNAMLASGSQDRTARVFSIDFTPPSKANGGRATASLRPLATLKGHKRGVWSVRFSPVDLALATGSGDKTIRLWSLRDFACVKIFEGHTNSVLKLLFCSAGMQLLSAAGDGLVKLWNVKEEECIDTLDGHEEKVWSLALGADEEGVVSVGADGVINFWKDTTQSDLDEQRQKREEEVKLEQDFGNFLTMRDYRNAIALALQMGQPRRLLGLFKHVAASRPEVSDDVTTTTATTTATTTGAGAGGKLLADALAFSSRGSLTSSSSKNPTTSNDATRPSELQRHLDAESITGLAAVDHVLSTLPPSQLLQLLTYIRDWNTSTRTSLIAQIVLHAILRFHSSTSLISTFETRSRSRRAEETSRLEDLELGIVDPEGRGEKERRAKERERRKMGLKEPELAEVLDALLPYTERHYERAERMVLECAVVEYSLGCMDALLGAEEEEEEDGGEGEDGEGRAEGEGDEEMTFGEQLGSASASSDEDEEM